MNPNSSHDRELTLRRDILSHKIFADAEAFKLWVWLSLTYPRGERIQFETASMSDIFDSDLITTNKALKELLRLRIIEYGLNGPGQLLPGRYLVLLESLAIPESPARGGGARAGNIDYDMIMAEFNKAMQNKAIPQISRMTPRRKSAVKARISEYGHESILKAIGNAAESRYLNAGTAHNFLATFDWIFRPNNFSKVLEGNYNWNAEARGPAPAPANVEYTRTPYPGSKTTEERRQDEENNRLFAEERRASKQMYMKYIENAGTPAAPMDWFVFFRLGLSHVSPEDIARTTEYWSGTRGELLRRITQTEDWMRGQGIDNGLLNVT